MADPRTDRFDPAFALESPALHGDAALGWIAETQRFPSSFARALEHQARALGVAPAKSDPAIGFDLYYDLVARHLGRGHRALRCYHRAALSGAGRWDDLSFDELHARCSYRASWWATLGIGPGSLICVVFPFGVEFAVSLLAALRLGAVVSWLEPQGPDFLIRRLTASPPQHIAAHPFTARQLGEFAKLVIAPDALAPLPETYSHTYGPGETCLQLWSPLRTPSDTAVPVPADAVYLGALRDGLACLALRPGDQLAAPGFHPLQHQPAIGFAAWILGAGYVELGEQEAIRDPALLGDTPLRTMGVTPGVRDAYLHSHRGRRPPWDHIVRNPEEPCDWEAWRGFLEGCDLGEVAISNLVVEAAAGGALLCSARRPGAQALAHLQDVMPAPGRPWQLIDFTRTGQPSPADCGVYARTVDDKPVEPRYLVLARRGAAYLYGGAIEPRRVGRVYPSDEVLAVAARAGWLDGAAVVPVISGGAASETRFVLIGLTGDEPPAAAAAAHDRRCRELRERISAGLGAELVPDAIALFSLYARRSDGELDPGWIQAQYLGGLLFRKAEMPVFQRLAALRRSARAAAGPAPIAPIAQPRETM
jgi:hypothetical protein